MLPALAEGDEAAFGEALFEFNARAGEPFAAVQGGAYASARVAELIGFLRADGLHGVGQSSWGPTVFAVTPDEDRAAFAVRRLREACGLGEGEVLVTRACNHGAVVSPT